MRTKTNKVYLSEAERNQLIEIVKNGTSKAKKIVRANILLLLDENQGKVMEQIEIAKICHVSVNVVRYISKQFVESGLDSTLTRAKREIPPIQSKITGDIEAKIIALSCSAPPDGRSRWTLQLLADKSVELNIIDSISDNTVMRVLKKRIKTPSS